MENEMREWRKKGESGKRLPFLKYISVLFENIE